MDNSVTMSLKDYDALRDRIMELEKELADLDSLNIFTFERSYDDDNLHLILTAAAQQYLDKAFAEYNDKYSLKPLPSLYIWNAAEKIKEQPKE